MIDGKRHRKPHFKDILPKDPQVVRWSKWIPENKLFHQKFLRWLHESSFSDSVMGIYGVAGRQVLGFWNKPYWTFDPETDLPIFWEHLQTRALSPSSLAGYQKGLKKWEEFWRLQLHKPPRPKKVDWDYYLDPLPAWLAQDVRAFINLRRRSWKLERQHERSLDTLSHLTLCLRWISTHFTLHDIHDLTPDDWYAYVDDQIQNGIQATTLNGKLFELLHFLHYLQDEGRPICARMLLIDPLKMPDRLPRDAPVEHLRRLFQEIQIEATAFHRGKQRGGRMDLAWFLLMLHSGLRTGEVRSLRFEHLDLVNRRVRIEQSKGLKDRVVYLTEAAVTAIQSYLEVRGPREALPEQMFVYAHKPLSESCCGVRLRTFGRRCGVIITPHQLRHSCATLLLNAGAPVLTVQSLLGHKFVDTTLGYARLYDGTIAAGYYGAMTEVERRLKFTGEIPKMVPPSAGELVALVDALNSGALNSGQMAVVQALRAGILALAGQGKSNIEDVKEPAVGNTSEN